MRRLVAGVLLLFAATAALAQECATLAGAVRLCESYTRIDADGIFLAAAKIELPQVAIVDMSTPSAPVELGHYLAPARIDDVAISGRIVLAATAGQIDVVSIADPRNPVLVGRLNTNGFYHRVTIDGTLAAAINTEFQRYEIIDVTNPAAPAVTAMLANTFGAEDVTLSGTLLLGGAGAIENIDVSNRAAPVRLPLLIPIPEIIYRNLAATDRVVVMEQTFDNDDEIHLSTAQPPVAGGARVFSPGTVLDVAVSGCRAFFITESELRTIDISNCGVQCGTCVPSETNVCLGNGRFSVSATWRTTAGQQGVGHRVTLSDDTAGFWFFGPSNTEMMFKVLNGCAVNNRHWFFAGGLTDVEVTVTVRDTRTGAVRTYVNPLGRPFQIVTDTSAFVCP